MTTVRIGRLGRPHGTRGEIALDGCSLTAEELLAIRSFTWIGRDGATAVLRLESARPMLQRILVHFEGYSARDQAAELTLGELEVERDRLPDPGPGVAYAFQLIGLRVVTVDGRGLGKLADVWTTGANPVYVVRGEREWLIPATPGVVRRVDLAGGVVTVDLPAGLEDI